MRPDDFFTERTSLGAWGDLSSTTINSTLLVELRRGRVEGRPDVEVPGGLARLIHDDLETEDALVESVCFRDVSSLNVCNDSMNLHNDAPTRPVRPNGTKLTGPPPPTFAK